jgi:hypothetical protein
MKKSFQLALIGLSAMVFMSCKKDYTCKCYINGFVGFTEVGSFSIHDTKSNAKSTCNNKVATYPDAYCNIQ